MKNKTFDLRSLQAMRKLVLAVVICCASGVATGQCPLRPLEASVDPTGRSIAIHYQNASTRTVKDVHFVMLIRQTSPDRQSVIASFSTRDIVHPNQDRTTVFASPTGLPSSGNAELVTQNVSFTDNYVWRSTTAMNNTCRVLVSRR